MLATSVETGVGGVDAKGVDPQGADGLPKERLKLPVNRIILLFADTPKLVTKPRSGSMFKALKMPQDLI